MTAHVHPDYLVIGYICHDVTPDGRVTGGTAAYSARTAQVLGCETAVLTSCAAEDDWQGDLPGVTIERVIASVTTTFENVYTDAGRIQYIHALADRLLLEHLTPTMRRAGIIHLGPIANEVAPEMVRTLAGGESLIGVTPQGWMRRWDEYGRVFATAWESAPQILPYVDVAVISDEDIAQDVGLLAHFRDLTRILVLTEGPSGCTVYVGDEQRHVPGTAVQAVNLTGAGDIFATAYFLRLRQTQDPWEAGRFANAVAAVSLTAVDLDVRMDNIATYYRGQSLAT